MYKIITYYRNNRKNRRESIDVRSLTCFFVYKVLNQEVLDDRGKFASFTRSERKKERKLRFFERKQMKMILKKILT